MPPSLRRSGCTRRNLKPRTLTITCPDGYSACLITARPPQRYGGPCPPAGDKPHHYQITVFAVDVDKLPDAKNDAASAALVGFDLHFHTLAKATLVGLYGR
jgi:phosphatidylethanolamine-binding protein (PEBP) family uncharacterized protein